jgi:hypothetical protein
MAAYNKTKDLVQREAADADMQQPVEPHFRIYNNL